jgi:hypothetical protein
MPRNKLSDLRNHLFETLEALKDKDNPMEIARAKVISDVAQTVINSAKVEIEFLEAVGSAEGGEFFEQPGLLVTGRGHGPMKRLA